MSRSCARSMMTPGRPKYLNSSFAFSGSRPSLPKNEKQGFKYRIAAWSRANRIISDLNDDDARSTEIFEQFLCLLRIEALVAEERKTRIQIQDRGLVSSKPDHF